MTLKVKSYLICLVLALVSCGKTEGSPELEKHFTKTQIEDLNSIRHFFISEILEGGNQNFVNAFDQFFSNYRLKGTDVINNQFKIEEFDEVLNSISKSTQNEIWEKSKGKNLKNGTEFEWLAPKYNGKYRKFLKGVSGKNEIIKEYYNRMEATGDYNPVFFNESLVNSHDKINYGSEQIQIILAVHYFSLIYNYLTENKLK